MEKPLSDWIWKINGIIILFAGIAALVVALFAVYDIFLRNIEPEPVVNLADDPKGVEKWRLSRGEAIPGTDILMLSLISENKEVSKQGPMPIFSSGRSYSGRAYNLPAKNILFLDMSNNQSRWLFDTTSQLILSSQPFPYYDRTELDKRVSPKVIFYSVVIKDTNEDGILNNQDQTALAISNTNGDDFQIIIDSFDRIIAKETTGKNKALIVYQNEGTVYSMLFGLDPFKAISTKALPKVMP